MKTLRRKRKRERGEGYQPYSRMGGISRTGTEGVQKDREDQKKKGLEYGEKKESRVAVIEAVQLKLTRVRAIRRKTTIRLRMVGVQKTWHTVESEVPRQGHE